MATNGNNQLISKSGKRYYAFAISYLENGILHSEYKIPVKYKDKGFEVEKWSISFTKTEYSSSFGMYAFERDGFLYELFTGKPLKRVEDATAFDQDCIYYSSIFPVTDKSYINRLNMILDLDELSSNSKLRDAYIEKMNKCSLRSKESFRAAGRIKKPLN